MDVDLLVTTFGWYAVTVVLYINIGILVYMVDVVIVGIEVRGWMRVELMTFFFEVLSWRLLELV